MILWCYDVMVLVFEYISRISTGEASAASVYTSAVHSYLRSILTAEMPSVIFIALNYEFREICRMILWYYGIMVLWYYGIMVLWYYGIMVLVFEYIYILSHSDWGKRAQRACITSAVYSYLRSILTAGMPRSFLSL